MKARVTIAAICFSIGLSLLPAVAGAEDVVELWRNPFGSPKAVAVYSADGSCWASMGMSVTHVAADGSVLGQRLGLLADLVAVDPRDGSFWVATWDTGRIIHLAEDGAELWSSDGYTAYGISVDSTDGSCWVADPSQKGLVHLAADGSVLLTVTTLVRPGAVAANSADGSCWVVDQDGFRLVHLSADGDEVSSTLDLGHLVAVAAYPSDGSCWVVADDPWQVIHLKADGTVWWAADLPQAGMAVAVNPTDGSCWVASNDNGTVGQISHFSATGGQLWTGDAFRTTHSLAVNSSDGSCWVADWSVGLVHLSADGEETWSAPARYAPWAVSASPLDGSCWVANWSEPDLLHLASDGEELWSMGGVNYVDDVAVDLSDGSCWLSTDTALVRLAADGTEMWSGALPGPASLAASPSDGSCWATVGDDGPRHLMHFASDGAVLLDSTDIPSAWRVAVDPADGSVWVSDAGRVVHLSAEGQQLSERTGLSDPGPLSVNIADGSVWVTDMSGGGLIHLAADGTELWSGEGYYAAYTVYPAIAASPTDGTCWITAGSTSGSGGWGRPAVTRLGPTGEVLWSGFVACCSIDLSVNPADGSCWVAGLQSGQIVHLGITGAEHKCYAVAYAPNPATVTSGGTASLNAFGADNLGHGIASWSWSDGGAGGSFSPSPEVRHPTYTAPTNRSGADLFITLTVTIATADDTPLTASASTVLRVRPEYLLQIVRQGSGFIRVNGEEVPATWSRYLDADEHVTLEAAPSYGWEFAGWWGDVESSGTQFTMDMNRDCHLTARFTLPAGTALLFPVDHPEEEFTNWTGWASAPGSGWEYGPPLAGGGQPIGDGGAVLGVDPSTSHSGGNIIGYVIGGNYQPGMTPQYLTTSPLDFRGRQNVSLHFWRWLEVEDQHYDTAAVEVNTGSGWQQLWTNPTGSPPIYTFDTAWTEVEYPLPQADGKANVQVRWQMGPTDAWATPSEYGGWSLDDISFQCAADRYMLGEFLVQVSFLWEQTGGLGAAGSNTGDSTWDDSFGLRARTDHTPTGAWGVDYIPFSQTDPIAPTDSWSCEAALTAPPVSTIAYAAPVDPRAAGRDATLPCEWGVWQETTGFIHGDRPMVVPVTIGRFTDTLPGSDGNWARFYVEELAGAVPEIVRGYGGGIYKPQDPVTRDQLAVYIARAVRLDTSHATGTVFQDVPADSWAAGAIEACANAGIIAGYPNYSFHPTEPVTRAGMCKFIANGRAYVDPYFVIPETVAAAPFPDVPADHWAARWILACKDRYIVQGYPNGNFQPDEGVNRGQMAVFVWRAFLRDRESVVILGGPTLSRYPPTVTQYAVGSVSSATIGGTLHASVLLDAVRLTASALTARFDLSRIVSEDMLSPVANFAAVLDGEQVAAAHTAAMKSGNPYLPLTASIATTGLEPGDYLLVTKINDVEVTRQVRITLTPTL